MSDFAQPITSKEDTLEVAGENSFKELVLISWAARPAQAGLCPILVRVANVQFSQCVMAICREMSNET